MRQSLKSKDNIDSVVKSMTVEEKLRLVGAQSTIYSGAIPELGIPSMCLADGATGINLGQVLINASGKLSPQHMGVLGELFGNLSQARNLWETAPEDSPKRQVLEEVLSHYPYGEDPTSFPSGVVVGATWSPKEAECMGQALGKEMYACGVDVVLGPNVDIQRDPLCGRTYECFGEDPYLVGKIGAGEVRGIQSQGVAACLKHFALNNQETDRNFVDTHVSDRAKREIYYKGFEIAIKEGEALSVMSAYNKVDGQHCAENKMLLTDVLRNDLGFDGCVVSDWGAVHDEPIALTAGNDMVLPGPKPMEQAAKALKDGSLSMDALDTCVKNILKMLLPLKVFSGREEIDFSIEDSRRVAYETAVAGSVLLKNEDVLPMSPGTKVSIWGKRSKMPLAYGAGSTEVASAYMTNIWDYSVNNNGEENCFYEEYADAKMLIYVAGEPGQEGADMSSMNIEAEDYEKLPVVLKEAKNRGMKTIVVLNVASPVDMRQWIDNADGILCIFLPGCEGGHATADMLFGIVAPAGRLPVSFPVKYTDTPTCINFPGKYGHVTYGEDIYLGYRYYDYKEIEPLFPFGYGLTYTTFLIESNKTDYIYNLDTGNTLEIKVDVTNTGTRYGAEVVQLYLSHKNPVLRKPVKELKAFEKVYLNPGETKTVSLFIDRTAFDSWDPGRNAWTAQPGDYEIHIGRSSRDIVVTRTLSVNGTNPYAMNEATLLRDVLENREAAAVLMQETPFVMRLLEENPMIRLQTLGFVLDGALIREIPDAVAAKAKAKGIFEKLEKFSVA